MKRPVSRYHYHHTPDSIKKCEKNLTRRKAPCIIRSSQFAVRSSQFAVRSSQFAVRSSQFAVETILSFLHISITVFSSQQMQICKERNSHSIHLFYNKKFPPYPEKGETYA